MAALLLSACAALRTVSAQRVTSSVDVQATRLQYADTINTTATGITPSLHVDWSRASLGAWGTYAQLGHAWSADGSLGGSLFTPSAGVFSGELSGTVGGSTHQDGTRTGSTLALARLHADGARVGAWAGGGVGSTWDGSTWRTLREGDFGAWLSSGPASLSLTAQPTAIGDSIHYTDFGAEARTRVGIFDLAAVGGTRAGSRLPALASSPTTWGSVSATAWVFPRVALIANAGTYPVDYTQGFPGGRFASLGIRIALARPAGDAVTMAAEPPSDDITAFEMGGEARGLRTIRIRAPGAKRVEITGDFTQWQPRRLASVGGGWYAVAVPLAPGTYQMTVRRDGGAWRPPPSLTTVKDEFGGVAGVLVVP